MVYKQQDINKVRADNIRPYSYMRKLHTIPCKFIIYFYFPKLKRNTRNRENKSISERFKEKTGYILKKSAQNP